jgi:small subunit ribosomal protein S6
MRCYEVLFLIRHELQSADLENKISAISSKIEDINGEVVKNEYWGLRYLAYPIRKQKKVHYVLLGVKSDNHEFCSQLKDSIQNDDSIMRHSATVVKDISPSLSPIAQEKQNNMAGETKDVTSGSSRTYNKDKRTTNSEESAPPAAQVDNNYPKKQREHFSNSGQKSQSFQRANTKPEEENKPGNRNLDINSSLEENSPKQNKL